MQATYTGDTSAPGEKDLQSIFNFFTLFFKTLAILKTLSGDDKETKALSGFQTIINKLQTSDSRKHWNYLMKNLVLLDRTVEEGLFVEEIAQLNISDIEDYRAGQQRYSFVS